MFIKVERYGMVVYVAGRTQGYRIRIDITETEGLPKELFVFLQKTVNNQVVDEFTNIASPADIEEYPVDEPAPAPEPPFFRKASVDLIFRNITLANDAWNAMKQDFQQLIETEDYMSNLELQETVTFGNPSSSSSSSSGSSQSSSSSSSSSSA